MADPITIGIIGAGGIAQKLHLPQLEQIPDFRVTWLCGRREGRLKTLAEKFNVPRWTQNPNDLLEDSTLDAVIVAQPHPLHVQTGVLALQAGKHVLMQKPLCADMQEANTFVDFAERSRCTVLCFPHFSPEIYKAREMVAEGILGKPS